MDLWLGLVPGLLFLLAGTLASAASLGLVVLFAPRGYPDDAHWSERARFYWPVARGVSFAATVPLVSVSIGYALVGTGGVSSIHPLTVFGLGGWIVYGLLLPFALWRVIRRMRPATKRYALRGRDALWTMLLVPVPILIPVLAAGLLPPDRPWIAVPGVLLVIAALVFHNSGGSRWLGRFCGFERPAPAPLERLVGDAADRAGLARPRVLELRHVDANAYVFPFSRVVGFTTPAIDLLDEAEQRGIADHEIGHLKEPASVRMLRSIGVVTLSAVAASRLLLHQVGPWSLIVVGLAIVLLGLGSMRTARRMEHAADEHAHQQGDPAVFARAIEKLHAHNLTPAVVGSRNQTHPDLVDRLEQAGLELDWPRPGPPLKRFDLKVAPLSLAMALVIPALCLRDEASWRGEYRVGWAWTDFLVYGGSYESACRLAEGARQRGDLDAAGEWLEIAARFGD